MISLAFRPRLLGELRAYGTEVRADLLAGIRRRHHRHSAGNGVCRSPAASPEQGLVTAVITGFIISAVGAPSVHWRPTGAFIVVLYGILIRYGWANLMICTMMAGVILMVMGAAKLGRLDPLCPNSVIMASPMALRC